MFFRIAVFHSKTSTEETLLENRKFFKALTIWNSYCFGGAIVQNKDKHLRKIYFFEALLHSIDIFRRATFWKKLFFHKNNILDYLLFLESYLFREATFSKSVIFYSSYLFRRANFLQLTFSGELLIHSYASLPKLHFLFITQ